MFYEFLIKNTEYKNNNNKKFDSLKKNKVFKFAHKMEMEK